LKGDKGFIQCEGILGCDAVKLLFREEKSGKPKKDECDKFSHKFCEADYTKCDLFKVIERKYDE
jgi:hypothetical protein